MGFEPCLSEAVPVALTATPPRGLLSGSVKLNGNWRLSAEMGQRGRSMTLGSTPGTGILMVHVWPATSEHTGHEGRKLMKVLIFKSAPTEKDASRSCCDDTCALPATKSPQLNLHVLLPYLSWSLQALLGEENVTLPSYLSGLSTLIVRENSTCAVAAPAAAR